MYLDEIRDYCLTKVGAYEDLPFGPGTLTMKVKAKIFVFIPLDSVECQFAIKGYPDRLVDLREQFEDIKSGPYLNPRHWVSVHCTGSVPDSLIRDCIDMSYELVVKGLTAQQRVELGR